MRVTTSPRRSRYSVVVHDALTLSNQSLGLHLLFRGSIHRRPSDFIDNLISELRGPVSYYAAGLGPPARSAIGGSINSGKRGRKPNIALSILISDCNRAYWAAMGRDPEPPFERFSRSGVLKQSPCVALARHLHEAITGQQYPWTMERQAKIARRMTRECKAESKEGGAVLV